MNKCFLLAATLAALLVSTTAFANPDIEIAPLAYDFGDVGVGNSVTTVVTVTNLDPVNFAVIYDVVWYQISNPALSFTTSALFPYVLLPGQTLYIDVKFSPTVIGYTSAVLVIETSDPYIGNAFIPMGGAGIDVEPPTSLDDLLAFYDAAVANGTLTGSGPGNSAGGRLTALRNMIEAAGDLLDNGYTEQACQQLWDAYLRADGESRPPDFVQGLAAQDVADYILALIFSYCG